MIFTNRPERNSKIRGIERRAGDFPKAVHIMGTLLSMTRMMFIHERSRPLGS